MNQMIIAMEDLSRGLITKVKDKQNNIVEIGTPAQLDYFNKYMEIGEGSFTEFNTQVNYETYYWEKNK